METAGARRVGHLRGEGCTASWWSQAGLSPQQGCGVGLSCLGMGVSNPEGLQRLGAREQVLTRIKPMPPCAVVPFWFYMARKICFFPANAGVVFVPAIHAGKSFTGGQLEPQLNSYKKGFVSLLTRHFSSGFRG